MNKIIDFFKKFKREPKELSQEEKRKKMIIFFGFYLFFFIFLFIWMKQNRVDNVINDNEETVITYKMDNIENNNYSYVYEIEENDNTYIFKGIRNEENYEVSEYKYKVFLDIYNIKKLIKNSKYLYKVDNNSEISYKYEIDNKKIASMMQLDETIEEGINNIVVYVDGSDNVYKIELDFSNYMKSVNEYDMYHLTLYYGVGEL